MEVCLVRLEVHASKLPSTSAKLATGELSLLPSLAGQDLERAECTLLHVLLRRGQSGIDTLNLLGYRKCSHGYVWSSNLNYKSLLMSPVHREISAERPYRRLQHSPRRHPQQHSTTRTSNDSAEAVQTMRVLKQSQMGMEKAVRCPWQAPLWYATWIYLSLAGAKLSG